ncbi:MAG: DUF4837 family protein [Marinifilaceae bacterium]|jgi:hypothetical protein|nr:DUF4837 family protein [Marinifilaceae bacterium]
MKKLFKLSLFSILITVLFCQCNFSAKDLDVTVTGKSGELIVVVDNNLYKSELGDTIKSVLGDSQFGLPQAEPIFSILHLDHANFSSMFKTHRSILDIRIKKELKETKMRVKNDMYAKGQSFIRLEAPSNEKLIEFIDKNRSKLVSYYHVGERNRKIRVIKSAPVQQIFDTLKYSFNFSLAFPAGYNLNKVTKDFIWVSKETTSSSMGMFIYTYDYKSASDIEKANIIAKRNAFLKQNVPGPVKDSYMSTDIELPISYDQFTFKTNYAYQMRGLWEVKGDFMAGPFLNISFINEDKTKIVCLDSYVYHPSKEKREMLREMEAIMYTYKKVNEKK